MTGVTIHDDGWQLVGLKESPCEDGGRSHRRDSTVHRRGGGDRRTGPGRESFRTMRAARFAEVLRGVSFTPER